MNPQLVRLGKTMLIVLLIPIVALLVPVGFIPLYILLSWILVSERRLLDDQGVDDPDTLRGINELEDFANGGR